MTSGTVAGIVYLVGAGPGDPELLTLRAHRLLQRCDALVYDALVPLELLELLKEGCELHAVGKRRGQHSVPQPDTNALLVQLAGQHRCVVRLKGGDPFVFGRGGEEMQACREAGVPVEVVPGVSAALAAAAGAGAPLTHRGMAQAVTFVTGHAASGQAPDLDWNALASANHTVVVYMGLSSAPIITARLIEAGRAASTPVLAVENASRPDERRVLSTLGQLPSALSGIDGPAILIIGEVAALAEDATLLDQVLERVQA